VARRYGLLPSQMMRLGDSLDMKCANLSLAYEDYLNKKKEGNHKDKTDHGLSTQDLQQMVNSVKESKHGGKDKKK
jgi:hypothetical protein